jgi:uncharacterized membrane protein
MMLIAIAGFVLCLAGVAIMALAIGRISKTNEWIAGLVSLAGLFICWIGLLFITTPTS